MASYFAIVRVRHQRFVFFSVLGMYDLWWQHQAMIPAILHAVVAASDTYRDDISDGYSIPG